MAASPKMMVTLVWNTHGLLVVDMLPKGATFDTDYCCDDILSEIFGGVPSALKSPTDHSH
jgi:hypothetical protein